MRERERGRSKEGREGGSKVREGEEGERRGRDGK